ncbi:MAG: hypothetical protein V2J07_12110 [Anaerolineae bacterium]|jgi:hypothetical protein|nr:hypothetical protein [Anaerolineae bacterium]
MTQPILNTNCHLILQHPDVNGGENCGFILAEKPHQPGPAVVVEQEHTSDGEDFLFVSFDVLLAEDARAPDGRTCPWSRSEMTENLFAVLQQADSITLSCTAGVISGLSATGRIAEAKHTKDASLVSCQLSRGITYFRPVPLEDFQASVWDGIKTWENAVWR